MQTKTIPNDPFAEQSVIGAMFLSKYALSKACESLTSDAFFLNSHAKIFTVLKELSDKKVPIDIATVSSELKQKDWLNETGGIEYLTEVLDLVPTAANVDYYIKIVEDHAILRKLIETSTEITTMGYESDSDVNVTLDEAEKKILSIVKNRRSTEFRNIKEVLYKTQSDLEKLAATKGEITGLPTGFYDFDKLTSGLHANEFIILAARPAMGKTAFALNIATHIATTTDRAVASYDFITWSVRRI